MKYHWIVPEKIQSHIFGLSHLGQACPLIVSNEKRREEKKKTERDILQGTLQQSIIKKQSFYCEHLQTVVNP